MSWIGIWSEHAQTYLLVITLITFFAFSLPLFFKPCLWAKLLLWKVPDDTHLTIYFGRCLGAFAIVTNIMFMQAALYNLGTPFILQFFILFCGLMVIVHIWGAVLRIQPVTETIETGFWVLLLILNFLFYPVQQ
ncbi:hypothetical protein ACFOEW_12475 [Alteromonas oceani]|uniref:Uncharacterized protein n=1 Tax=Alteromonas oceani TaxID=2071609 RepID=A0ABV7K2M7_9ALTE|nr:hypothetical protein [Alteromonas oceani]